MIKKIYSIYKNKEVLITACIPENKRSSSAVIIFAGGGYVNRAEHEGLPYAEFLTSHGITSFVVDYRVYPDMFPAPLQDAQRAVRWVRYHKKEFGLSGKVAVMGSSAGGHLCALLCTYRQPVVCIENDETDKLSCLPDAQILCYPVITISSDGIAHILSGKRLLGDRLDEAGSEISPELIADKNTPQAFIWHTFDDETVDMRNSLLYVKRLKEMGVNTEYHLFPHGVHGLGLAEGRGADGESVTNWTKLLLIWLKSNGFIEG